MTMYFSTFVITNNTVSIQSSVWPFDPDFSAPICWCILRARRVQGHRRRRRGFGASVDRAAEYCAQMCKTQHIFEATLVALYRRTLLMWLEMMSKDRKWWTQAILRTFASLPAGFDTIFAEPYLLALRPARWTCLGNILYTAGPVFEMGLCHYHHNTCFRKIDKKICSWLTVSRKWRPAPFIHQVIHSFMKLTEVYCHPYASDAGNLVYGRWIP